MIDRRNLSEATKYCFWSFNLGVDSPRSVWREEGGGYDSRQGWEDDYRFILGRLSLVVPDRVWIEFDTISLPFRVIDNRRR